MAERVRFLIATSVDQQGMPVVHLVRERSAKTMCRAFEVDQLSDEVGAGVDVCPACLDVLKVDWLMEYETTKA